MPVPNETLLLGGTPVGAGKSESVPVPTPTKVTGHNATVPVLDLQIEFGACPRVGERLGTRPDPLLLIFFETTRVGEAELGIVEL